MMDEDEMKQKILQATNKIMEASRMYKLPGHRSKVLQTIRLCLVDIEERLGHR